MEKGKNKDILFVDIKINRSDNWIPPDSGILFVIQFISSMLVQRHERLIVLNHDKFVQRPQIQSAGQ